MKQSFGPSLRLQDWHRATTHRALSRTMQKRVVMKSVRRKSWACSAAYHVTLLSWMNLGGRFTKNLTGR